MPAFPFLLQRNAMDCGPTCLYMVCKFYGRRFSLEKLRELAEIGKEGVNMLGISDAAEKIGFRSISLQTTTRQLKEDIKLPCILHWNQNHFIILYKIKGSVFYIADPGHGLLKYSEKEFEQQWISHTAENEKNGIVLLLEPTPDFYSKRFDDDSLDVNGKKISNIIAYLRPYKKLIFQLFLGMLIGSLLQLILPFLTQSIIDTGINRADLPFIYIILFAQLALLAGRLGVDFIRTWILYHISSRINISILTDFLIKLMKLPLGYFDSKKTGDIMQRMNDHNRIQSFLTGTSLSTIFSAFNLVIFSVVLASYNIGIFTVFACSSVLYVLWILVFLKKRKELDYKQFSIAAAEQGKTMEIIQGMQEIKLHGSEKIKRWQWERLQALNFRLGMKGLSLNQWQQSGAFLINEGKNIIITFLSARAVIKGEMTLGGMLAIQYIIGQLNSPIEQMINFVQSWQLAKISLDRLNEIHSLEDEEPSHKIFIKDMPANKTIQLNNVFYTYPGAGNQEVLKDINLIIPEGKTTAIVGTSGSGKTTLLKILLKFYKPQQGNIIVGEKDIDNLSHASWRKNIGVVMQESFIFNDTIASNIAIGETDINIERLKQACETANIFDFIKSLPLAFNTKIGAEGTTVSTGQRQRLLIARAVYKSPDYIFLDEATNSLDANNESLIIKNLNDFFKGRTVVIVAHRLSTVKNADQIVVLNNGSISEKGTHAELVKLKKEYFTLIKNQLELGE